MGPLHGIRVLDLSRVLAGPWATQALADLGAEVIKIERPDGGDDTRQWGPPYARDAQGRDTTESAYYLSTNRGKHSVAVDLALDEAGSAVEIEARVALTGRTGVEMEALTAVSVAALTVYDMCKSADRGMTLSDIRLVHKSGGKSGAYEAL